MARHRAQRHHFRVGCTLSLIAFFGLLSLFVAHSSNTTNVSANIANADTPYVSHIVPKSAPVPTSPDAPPKPTAAELRAAEQAHAAAELKAQQLAAAQAAATKAAADKAAAEKAAADAAAKAAAAKPTPPPAPAPAPSRAMNTDAYKAYAAGKVSASEFSCLDQMWTKESSWNPNAQNPSSTAYGIPQFLNSTWASTGYAKTSDPYTQIDAGLVYVNKSYGGACGAWSFWQAHNWY